MVHLSVLLFFLCPVVSYRHRRSSTESEERSHLTRKALLHSYDSIIADLTTDRTPEAIVEFTEIMNNADLSREERNEKLHLWGQKNNCEDALGVFKIKEELVEEEEKKERIRKVDMLSSVAYQIREVMTDEEMTEYEKKEVIDNLAETAPETVKPLLHALYPSLLKEQLSSDEIIGIPGQNFIDKVTDLNEILIDVLYQREELSLAKKREEIEGFIHNANSRVANVLRLLWPKIPRRRRHTRHLILKHRF